MREAEPAGILHEMAATMPAAVDPAEMIRNRQLVANREEAFQRKTPSSSSIGREAAQDARRTG
jgi:hypothetical protein